MKIKHIIFPFSFAIWASCSQASHHANANKSKQSVAMDIRSDTTGYEFHNVRELSRQLKLKPIDTGFDSLQIRVWFDHSLAKRKHLVIIERQNDEWMGQLYEMQVDCVDTLDYNFVKQYEKRSIKPVSGWQHLINELYRNNVQQLFGNNGGGADGIAYSVEILTAGTYTYYCFHDPAVAKDRNGESDMANIIALLEREFNFTAVK